LAIIEVADKERNVFRSRRDTDAFIILKTFLDGKNDVFTRSKKYADALTRVLILPQQCRLLITVVKTTCPIEQCFPRNNRKTLTTLTSCCSRRRVLTMIYAVCYACLHEQIDLYLVPFCFNLPSRTSSTSDYGSSEFVRQVSEQC